MVKVEELSEEELKAELHKREEAKRSVSEQAKAEKTRLAREETAKRKAREKLLEDKFRAAEREAAGEMGEARALLAKAESKVIEIAEKHGVPVDWNNGAYIPESISKWKDSSVFTPEEVKYFTKFVEEIIGYYDEYAEPGMFWQPSANC